MSKEGPQWVKMSPTQNMGSHLQNHDQYLSVQIASTLQLVVDPNHQHLYNQIHGPDHQYHLHPHHLQRGDYLNFQSVSLVIII